MGTFFYKNDYSVKEWEHSKKAKKQKWRFRKGAGAFHFNKNDDFVKEREHSINIKKQNDDSVKEWGRFLKLKHKTKISHESGSILDQKWWFRLGVVQFLKQKAARDAERTPRRRCKSVCNPSNRNLIRIALRHSFASHARTKRNDFPVRGRLTPMTPPNLRYIFIYLYKEQVINHLKFK